MARSTFGGTTADTVAQRVRILGHDVDDYTSATLTVWSAQTGGTQYTDLLVNGAASNSVPVDSTGQVPEFQGPDGVTVVWVSAGGARVKMLPAEGPTDTSVAGYVNDSASSTRAALDGTYRTVINAAAPQYGMAPTATAAANATALAAAIAAVPVTGGTVLIPAGTYPIAGDITISQGSVSLRGTGDATFLNFAAGGIVVNGFSGYTAEIGLHDISLCRTGAAGPAIRLKGGGSGTGVVHFNASNVRVRSSTGEGLLVDGSYIGTFVGCYFAGCATGIKTAVDSGGGTVYANNLTFVGGETVTCGVAMYLDHPVGLTFIGHAIEGSTTSGVEIPSGAYGVLFDNCYWESNAGWDLKVGTTAQCYNVMVRGGFMTTGTLANSIVVIRGRNLAFEDIAFIGYSGSPISIQEASANTVLGRVDNCLTSGFRTGVVSYGTATDFDRAYFRDGSAGVSMMYTASTVLDFPSIAAGGTASLAVTVTGAAVGDDATCHPNSTPESGLIFDAIVSAANTVTVRCTNVTAAAIDPVARTWRVRVWR